QENGKADRNQDEQSDDDDGWCQKGVGGHVVAHDALPQNAFHHSASFRELPGRNRTWRHAETVKPAGANGPTPAGGRLQAARIGARIETIRITASLRFPCWPFPGPASSRLPATGRR